jgi:Ulp1 family protease
MVRLPRAFELLAPSRAEAALTAPGCTHSIVRIFPGNVLPCPVIHQQNSRATHGMNQPPFRSSQVRIATHPNSKHQLAHSNHNSPFAPFLIGSSAIRSARNSSVISVELNSDRSKNACLRARFSHISRTGHRQPHRTSNACLIASRQLSEIQLTSSHRTRKLFLIARFCACLADHRSPITLDQPLP